MSGELREMRYDIDGLTLGLQHIYRVARGKQDRARNKGDFECLYLNDILGAIDEMYDLVADIDKLKKEKDEIIEEYECYKSTTDSTIGELQGEIEELKAGVL